MPADADAVADVYLSSRKTFLAFAPLTHSDAATRQWIAAHVIPSGTMTLAVKDSEVVGMMAISHKEGCAWMEHFYLAPGFTGQGIGARLLAHAKAQQEGPIRLYTFQANTGARRFYERHGFQALAFSDGQDNEERCPDVLYEWNAAQAKPPPEASHDRL